MWCWGWGYHGQLGGGDWVDYVATPQRVPGLTDAVQISAGRGFSCALRAAGWVECWGDVGQSHQPDRHEEDLLVPTRVEGTNGAVWLSSQTEHSCVVTA